MIRSKVNPIDSRQGLGWGMESGHCPDGGVRGWPQTPSVFATPGSKGDF